MYGRYGMVVAVNVFKDVPVMINQSVTKSAHGCQPFIPTGSQKLQ